jgi:hypothetical protein
MPNRKEGRFSKLIPLMCKPKYCVENISTFVSGGVQADRIRNITGRFDIYNIQEGLSSGAFFQKNIATKSVLNPDWANYGIVLGFDPSLVVPTGPDNAPINLSVRYWRRIA